MIFKSLAGLSCVITSFFAVSANAALVSWVPTNADVNFLYSTVSGYNLGIFDVDDFDTTQSNALMLNTGASVDTIAITASTGTDYTATSNVTGNSITLFNDNQFVLAITDGTSWFEPLSWFETAAGSNIYNITFTNGIVTSVDAAPAVVPAPAAVWLFGAGLLSLAGVARRKQIM